MLKSITKNLSMAAVLLGLAVASIGVQVATVTAAEVGGNYSVGQNNTGHSATGSGYTTTATVGGSNVDTKNWGQGFAQQQTTNRGDAYSTAGANSTPNGVNSYTGGGSNSAGESKGYVNGNGQGETKGGVGSDYAANAKADYTTYGYGSHQDGYGKYELYTK